MSEMDNAALFRRMMEAGQEMVQTLNPAMQSFGGRGAVFPDMPPEAIEAMFGQTFNPGGLDARTRLLLILAALTIQGATAEPQMRMTIRQARIAGATDREIGETIAQMAVFAGVPAMTKALKIAQEEAKEQRT